MAITIISTLALVGIRTKVDFTTDQAHRLPWLGDVHTPATQTSIRTMCAVPFSHAVVGFRDTIMNRALQAPLSQRELRQLLHLAQGKSFEPGAAAFRRFAMLGLAKEATDGFAITKLGLQRLDTEQASPAGRQTGWGRGTLFGRYGLLVSGE